MEETTNGEFEMIQFDSGNGTVEAYSTASLVLYSTAGGELAAAQRAWDVWRTQFAGVARPWKRDWRRQYG